MKEISIQSVVHVYSGIGELPEADQELINAAIGVRLHAYAPYSHFFVGAAVLLDDGTIVLGNNQENVAYPSGLCAERTALFAAGANFPGKAVLKIAIAASSNDFEVNNPVYPCGACRQVMSEYEQLSKRPMEILMYGASGEVHVVNGLINILPVAFNADNLKRR
ncbi:MAG: cytidine deaminase [Bacteroidia bacterium]